MAASESVVDQVLTAIVTDVKVTPESKIQEFFDNYTELVKKFQEKRLPLNPFELSSDEESIEMLEKWVSVLRTVREFKERGHLVQYRKETGRVLEVVDTQRVWGQVVQENIRINLIGEKPAGLEPPEKVRRRGKRRRGWENAN